MIGSSLLARPGSTGNNTHDGIAANVGALGGPVAFLFTVEAIGATPTVTFKFQGSVDGVTWYDVTYLTPAAPTTEATAGIVATTVSSVLTWLAVPATRLFTKYRCVTSANTNVTYRAEIIQASAL